MDINEMSGYGISQTIAKIIEEGFTMDEETGEILFQGDDLEALQEALDKKINSICGYIEFCENRADGLKKRKQEIETNQKHYTNKAEHLKRYLNMLLEMNGKTDGMETDDYRVSYRKSTKSEIYDEDALKKYIESKPELKEKYYKVTYEIKNKELSNDVKTGITIPGFRLVENKNLQIN